MEQDARDYIDESMVDYADYFRDQTKEWLENPLFRFGSIGSPETDCKAEDHGVWHARYLVQEGKTELTIALAKYLHCTVEALTECLESDEYKGPAKFLVDDSLWDELCEFAKQDKAISECGAAGFAALASEVYFHYKGLPLANAWCEELVKEFKNLSHQARAHPTSAELRILLHQRRIRGRDYFGSPDRARLKKIRHKVGHNVRRRARKKREPPAEPLSPMFWEGHDGTEEEDKGEDEEDDEDEGEEEEDLSKLSVKELKEKCKQLGLKVGGNKTELRERLEAAMGEIAEANAEDEDDDDDDGEPDDDDEIEEGMSAAEKEVLLKLRAAPRIERSELIKDRTFFCWDDDRKLQYFPLTVMETARPRLQYITVACLKPAGDTTGVYVIDPDYPGDTGNKKKDCARIDLIFDAEPLTGEVWRPVQGGHAGARAWCVVKKS